MCFQCCREEQQVSQLPCERSRRALVSPAPQAAANAQVRNVSWFPGDAGQKHTSLLPLVMIQVFWRMPSMNTTKQIPICECSISTVAWCQAPASPSPANVIVASEMIEEVEEIILSSTSHALQL